MAVRTINSAAPVLRLLWPCETAEGLAQWQNHTQKGPSHESTFGDAKQYMSPQKKNQATTE